MLNISNLYRNKIVERKLLDNKFDKVVVFGQQVNLSRELDHI